MTIKNPFKFILLSNNDFLFSEVDMNNSKEGFIKLIEPLRALISEDETSVSYNFIPWIPFTTDRIIPLSYKSIVTITSLSEEYIDLYKQAKNTISENTEKIHINEFDASLLN